MLNGLEAENSPFSEQQIVQLRQSLGQISPAQSLWLSGYLAGRLSDRSRPELPAPPTGTLAPVSVPMPQLSVVPSCSNPIINS